jgi:prepilin-type N-terminal cleavage/methylation domain-containing protein
MKIKRRAFTLIEIMVVVSIVSLLAALSISMMVRNRITTNETVAITSCKTIVSACQSYFSSTVPRSYPPSLLILGQSGAWGPSFIDAGLASGVKSGYVYTYSLTSPVSFTLNADPQFLGRTGVRFFYADETGRITARQESSAGPGDAPVS